jgi:hypothetical protein
MEMIHPDRPQRIAVPIIIDLCEVIAPAARVRAPRPLTGALNRYSYSIALDARSSEAADTVRASLLLSISTTSKR